MKKQVHYGILNDMKQYIQNFNPDDYESTGGYTDPEVIDYVRFYYDTHLPVDLNAWIKVNPPKESLIYGKGIYDQVAFVRDNLCSLVSPTYEEWQDNPPIVISTHRSKSVKLPVYQINLEKYGIEFVLRCNFYDWKISVKSDNPLDFDYMGLFDPCKKIPANFCEGFPRDKVYGSYGQSHSQFTIELISSYNTYVFFFLLKNYLGIKIKY